MKKKIFLVAFAIGFFMSLNCIAQNEYKVHTPDGDFIIKNLHIEHEEDTENLKAQVLNNTDKDWNLVDFKVDFYDSSGEKIGEGMLYVGRIQKGEETSVDTIISGMGKPLKRISVSEFKVSYISGEYPVKYVIVMEKPEQSELLSFADSFIDIKFYFPFSYDRISFALRNKTTSPIKIDWNQISYVDTERESHKIVHSGIKYIDRNKSQSPTVIPPTAKVEDILIPSDYIYWQEKPTASGLSDILQLLRKPEKLVAGWRVKHFFPTGPKAKSYKGKTFSIFMPLEINGKVKNYFFTFKIKDIK